ncbi:fungal specific transcription factor domain-containing protein [Aspergillus undulatus]|uniref:fungal specific transcription factor domain-containing protein n=1 Tax=Aspergillus undulatus TaxID=1810928 RepID=UPI003CCCBFBF
MSFLPNIKATLPAEANESDIHEETILQPTSQPTQTSLMKFKLRLFRLSAEVCSHISGPSNLDQVAVQHLDTAIAEKERTWDATFLVNGLPRLSDHARYAHWYILQTYANQLYLLLVLLLLHQPFHNPQSPSILPASRDRCVKSCTTLLNIQRDFCELPRLRDLSTE